MSLRIAPALPARRAGTVLAGLFLAAVMAVLSLGMPGTAAAATMPAGNYELKVRHSDRCLDVANFSTAHAADVIQGICHGRGRNQHWRFEATGGGYYEVIARHSNKCLDVAHGSRDHAADVIQGTCVGGTNQQWKFLRTEGDFYKVVARHSQRCLDVAHMSIAHAANVIQGDCWTPGFNQQWQLVKKKR